MSSDFFNKTFKLFSGRIIFLLLSVIQGAVVARTIGIEGYGIFAVLMIIPNYIDKFGRFGIGHSSSYIIAQKKFSIREVADNLFLLAIILGFLPVILVLPFLSNIISSISANTVSNPWLLIPILVSLPGSYYSNFIANILAHYEDVSAINAVRIWPVILNIILSIVFLLIFKLGLWGLIISTAIANLAGAIVGYSYYVKNEGVGHRFNFSFPLVKNLFSHGIEIYASTIANYLHFHVDILLMTFYLGPTEIGLYKFATSVLEKLWLIPSSAVTLVYPRSAKDKDKSAKLVAQISRLSIFILGLTCVGIFLFGEYAIRIVYGSDFVKAIDLIYILSFGIISMGAGRVILSYFEASGRGKISMFLTLISLTVNIALNLALIPLYGAVGVSIATLISYVILSLLLIYYFANSTQMPINEIIFARPSEIKNLISKLEKKFFNK